MEELVGMLKYASPAMLGVSDREVAVDVSVARHTVVSYNGCDLTAARRNTLGQIGRSGQTNL
jgi:hypothetical protein